jgi:hypothetical protein
MSTLLEKPIKVNRIVTTSVEHARAIEDPARAKIVEILYHQAKLLRYYIIKLYLLNRLHLP